MKHVKPLLLVFAATSLMTTGCASLGLGSFALGEKKPAYPLATKERPATQIVAMWRPSRGTHEGRPTRGFAGNIMFFTSRDTMPALVNGTVRVYVFDDQGTIEEQGKPIQQYDFPADAWNSYAELSKIGPSYSVFIPYPRPGKHEANCTVSLRLVPADGGPALFSEEAHITLDGTRNNKTLFSRSSKDTIDKLADKKEDQPVTQSYSIVRKKIVPQRVEPESDTQQHMTEGIQAALAERMPADDSDNRIEQVGFESADTDDKLRNDRAEFIRSRLADRRSQRHAKQDQPERSASTKHPLRRNVHPIEEFADEAPEALTDDDAFGEDFDRDDDAISELLREKAPQKTRRHRLGAKGSDAITVDMSGLHGGETHRREQRSQRPRNVFERQIHPLSDLEGAFDLKEQDEFSAFDHVDEDVVRPLND